VPTVYKSVQVPAGFQVNNKNRSTVASDWMDKVLNDMSNQGWIYHGTAQATTFEPPGCIGGLFGQPGVWRNLNVLIFHTVT
jgi:hypothetical protein